MRRSRHEKGGGKNQFLDLVRRVIIIAIEDVVLHPDLPVLAWIMAACSKGFRASEVHFHFVLRVVRDLANSTYREPCIRDDEKKSEGSYEDQSRNLEIARSKHTLTKRIWRNERGYENAGKCRRVRSSFVVVTTTWSCVTVSLSDMMSDDKSALAIHFSKRMSIRLQIFIAPPLP